MIKFNNNEITSIYSGSDEIIKIYSGNEVVYEKQAPAATIQTVWIDAGLASGTTANPKFISSAMTADVVLPYVSDGELMTSCTNMFSGCTGIINNDGQLNELEYINTSNVTNTVNMFRNCSSLITVPQFNTSNVTNITNMFANCSSLITVPQFNTSSVTNMSSVFYYCSSLMAILELNLTSCTATTSMFSFCTSLQTCNLKNVGVDISFAQSPNLSRESILYLFNNAKTVTGKTITLHQTAADRCTYNDYLIALNKGWTISPAKQAPTIQTAWIDAGLASGTTANPMFIASAMTNETVLPYVSDGSLITSCYGMFSYCSNITNNNGQLNELSNIDTSNVTNMTYMFDSCIKLTSVPEFDTSNATNMNMMFSGCTILTTIPEIDTSNVTDMQNMFRKCSGLTTVSELNLISCTTAINMFALCQALTTCNLKHVGIDISFLYSPNLSNASIEYIADNRGTKTNAITITLHADAKARVNADSNLLTKLSNANITIA
ncbi:DUF285 domain-containing protein [Parabacteroides sp. OttesenSCG-928-J18]|nr:DUF285 domain-containing protein [Parabacteroides sp. OttesenSCG-928-J18]